MQERQNDTKIVRVSIPGASDSVLAAVNRLEGQRLRDAGASVSEADPVKVSDFERQLQQRIDRYRAAGGRLVRCYKCKRIGGSECGTLVMRRVNVDPSNKHFGSDFRTALFCLKCRNEPQPIRAERRRQDRAVIKQLGRLERDGKVRLIRGETEPPAVDAAAAAA